MRVCDSYFRVVMRVCDNYIRVVIVMFVTVLSRL